jgi:hypothetical protein
MNSKDWFVLRKALKAVGMEEELDRISVEEFIMKRNPEGAVTRLRQVHSLINAVLEDPDNLVYTVFD